MQVTFLHYVADATFRVVPSSCATDLSRGTFCHDSLIVGGTVSKKLFIFFALI